MSAHSEADTLIIGGGVVGMSVAYGLARAGERVTLLDEGDDAYRAARGNFGLVWVQGKGVGCPNYTRWTLGAAAAWPAFAAELAQRTGVDVEYMMSGVESSQATLTLDMTNERSREGIIIIIFSTIAIICFIQYF